MVNTNKRAYREYNKVYFDIANIVIAFLVALFLGLTFFRVVREMFFFPIIFYLGTLMNILTCVRNFMDHNKILAIGMALISVIMIVISVYATMLYWL